MKQIVEQQEYFACQNKEMVMRQKELTAVSVAELIGENQRDNNNKVLLLTLF